MNVKEMALSKILWIGTSDVFTSKEANAYQYVMPLVEEEVLCVAFSEQYKGLKRLSKNAAINCTSRLALKVALSWTEYNPKWHPIRWLPGVIKASASTYNDGVRFIRSIETVQLLKMYCKELVEFGVIEEFVEGDHYEIDGFQNDSVTHILGIWQQLCNKNNTKIKKYKEMLNHNPPKGMDNCLRETLAAVGINNAPFCIEMIYGIQGWKVIDVHARLGEDKRLWGNRNPIQEIEAIINE